MADETNQNISNIPPDTNVTVLGNGTSKVKIFGVSISIRSLIALILVMAFCATVLMKLTVPESFTLLVSNVCAFYFGAHGAQNGNKNPI